MVTQNDHTPGPDHPLSAHEHCKNGPAPLVCFLLFSLLFPQGPATAQVKEVRRVLIIYELGLSSPGVTLVDQGIRTALEDTPYQIELYREYLETTLFPDPATQREFRQWFLHKYRDHKPDLIIAAGPSPLRFLAESHDKYFSGVPIVFCGTSKYQAENPLLDSHFTGVWEEYEPAKTLDAALHLLPKTKHLIVIGGTTSLDRHLQEQIEEKLAGYQSSIDITSVKNLTMPQLLEKVRHLPEHTIVFLSDFAEDAAGRKFIGSTQASPMIVEAANVPVFSEGDVDLGHGEVGGYVSSFGKEGRIVGDLAIKVLSGIKPADIPITGGVNAYMFDWRALKRWNLKETDLPAGSVVLNRQLTPWETYKRYFIAGIFLLLGQTLIIMGLIWQRAKRRKTEADLRWRLQFERLIADLSTTFINLNEEQLDNSMLESMSLLGNFLEFDRISLFELSQENQAVILVYTWNTPEFPPSPPRVNLPPLTWWANRFLKGEVTCLSGLESLPETARGEREFLREQNVTSIAAIPLKVQGEVRGLISFATGTRRVAWTESLIGQLKVIGDIFWNALRYKHSMEALVSSRATLRESEGRLHEIIESAMDAIIAVDEEQRIVVFNAAAQKMFGCTPQDAIGTKIDRFIPQRFREAHGGHIERFKGSGVTNHMVSQSLDLWALRANGQEFPIESSISQIETAGKRLFTAIIRDITDHKQAEEARFRHAIVRESSLDAIISVDSNALVVSWNTGAQRMYGYSEEEMLGRSLNLIIPAELQEEENETYQRVLAGERIEHHECIRLAKSGNQVDVSLTMAPLRDWRGNIIGISEIARDITLDKRAEAALRESEERFRLIANQSPVMIWMSDTDHHCTYVNQSWLEFTGRPLSKQLDGGWAEGIHPEDLDYCLASVEQAFAARQPCKMQYRIRRHDGEYRWILDFSVPRFNTDRSFAGYIGSCIDITERKLAEEALSTVSRKLIEAHEEERTRIARELHDDVTQRLALLAVNLDVLRGALPTSAEDAKCHVANIRNHIKELGMDVQALSHRLHSSKLEYLGLSAAAASFCREFSERKGMHVEFHSENIPKSLSQEISLCLFRVLQEALQNAVKHSGSQDLKVSITFASGEVLLTVADAGCGFDIDEALKTPGLGIISMIERLKIVQGELQIDSQKDHGTVISARVPLPAVPAYAAKA